MCAGEGARARARACTHELIYMQVYLYLVMEYLPSTLHRSILSHSQAGGHTRMPLHAIKVISWQVLRGLAHMHRLNICHRDVKVLDP